MSAQFLLHLGFLFSAVLITLFWTANPALSGYTVQLIALLVIFYFLSRFLTSKKLNWTMALDGLILTVVTLLLVSQTGGLASPIFFLVYILMFGLSLMFDPLITLTLAVTICFLFYKQATNMNSFLEIIGLLLITPIAMYFGRQYLKVLEEDEKIKIIIKKKVELETQAVENQEETMLWLTLVFKEHVSNILDASSNLISNTSNLSNYQKDGLQKIHENAKRLLKMGERLQKKDQ